MEVADIVRAAGEGFVERSRRWLTREHLKVLRAIVSSWSAKTPPSLISLDFQVVELHAFDMKILLIVTVIQSLNLLAFALFNREA
jgi:hypothetical protein